MNKILINYITVHFNDQWVGRLGLTPEQSSEYSNEYEALDFKKLISKGHHILQFVMLRGKKGEVAYLNGCTEADLPSKHKIVFELPLSLTVNETRFFTESVREVFRGRFISDVEFSRGGVFKRIVKPPYNEFPSVCVGNMVISSHRERTFADKKPHGTFSVRPEVVKKRNAWIRERFQLLSEDGVSASEAYSVIQKELKKDQKRFGVLKVRKHNPYILGIDAIRDIIKPSQH